MARSIGVAVYNDCNISINSNECECMGVLRWAFILLLSGCVSTDYADKKAYDEITIKGHEYLLVKSDGFDGLALSHAGHCRAKHY